MSLPAWERGLKLGDIVKGGAQLTSLPAWERGLKPVHRTAYSPYRMSLPAWERGLKRFNPLDGNGVKSRSPRGSVD